MQTDSPSLGSRNTADIPGVLAQCLRHAPGFVALVMGRSHVFEFVNDAYSDFLGLPVVQIKGRPAFDVLSGVRGQGFEELIERVWATGEPYVGKHMRVRIGTHKPNAREMFVDFVMQPVFDQRGAMAGIFFQAHDVTELHRMAEAHRIAEKNQDIFLSKLVHELLSPLGAIRGAVDVLARAQVAREPLVGRMLRIVQRQASGLGALVDELSDVARIKLGSAVLARCEPVVLQAVVRDALDTCAPALQERQQVASVLLPERPVQVMGDALKLRRVLVNLLTNASKYTPVQGRVEVRLEESGPRAVLCVADDGIGLSRAALDRVFDLFSQEQEGTGLRQGGLGIGLALVRQLVELHGGTVEAHSEGPGQGASFVVRLPACAG
ncbi:PAS domain-containing sensor histidine kinase [Ramlibacter sp. AW1]|uniref:histidine kinase n=1 Tax=Ramlibacter aurantiacus TaxID=2801330 RepID=A0A936ZE73_9BURK|nr:PAS domain-containing sensor histidine kinase [Ramlibacter aurantiacus]MBL0419934.1 PAS domain-containing sensor histidine kinase [Ramlibacter aurantiacus]